VKKIFVSAAILLAAGCAGSTGPGNTPTPTPTPTTVSDTLIVRDGWTGADVAASANPAAPARNAAVHVEASGYLPRDTVFVGEPIYLWPSPLEYLESMVYFEEVGGRLSRWTASGFTVGLGTLFSDAVVRTVFEDAAAEVGRTTGLTVAVGSRGDVAMAVAPEDPGFAQYPDARALTYLELIDNNIVGTRTVFQSRADITGESPAPLYNVVLHELGHVIGLGGSPSPDDIMGDDDRVTQARVFSADERVVLKVMYAYRRPGNVSPDRDPGVADAARRRTTVLIAR
jgi:hypothetical protein